MSLTETKISTEKIREALEYIIAFFGKDFINSISNKRQPLSGIKHNSGDRKRKYGHLAASNSHPLSQIWEKGYANYRDLIQRHKTMQTKSVTLHYSLRVNLSKELLELVDIAENLREISEMEVATEKGELRKAGAKQLWGKRLEDAEEFEKAIYEIKVASSLRRNGFKVYFVEERVEKTPDFFVEKDGEKTYIECKQKDKKSERDQRNENLWNTVLTSSLKFMDRVKKNYGIVVKSEVDLSNKNSSLLINYIQNLIRNSQSGTYREGDFEIISKELGEFDEIFKGSFSINLDEFGVKANFPTAIFYQNAIVRFSETFKVEYKNPRFIGFVSTVIPDRIKSILGSLDHAYKQIPKGGPGIVYIEINTSLYKDPQEIARDLEFVKKRLNGKLNLITRVNAAILTASSYVQKEEKTFYRVEISCFRNSNPASHLGDQFLTDISKVKIR
jgi:hypothetical protein